MRAKMLEPVRALALLCLLLAGCGGEKTAEPSPVPDPVPPNLYADEDFQVVNGFLTYEGDAPSFIGVDVSAHQEEIDWRRVAAAGVQFAMIRVGYRGYTQGQIYKDDYFQANIEGALAAGLDVGVYFFSQAVTRAEALEEAAFTVKCIEGYDLTYPVVFDWERQSGETSRTKNTPGETVTSCAITFCQSVEAAGWDAMVYFSPHKAYTELELEELLSWPFWLAHYTQEWRPTDFRYHFAMWQYACDGAVDGIEGDVDLNLCLTDFSSPPSPSPESAESGEGAES